VAHPETGRIFVVPAKDDADEIAAAMLAQLLGEAGYAAIPFTVDFAGEEKLGIVDPRENDTFCISAVPPFAFAGAITLVRQLKLRFPRTQLMVGVWGFSGNTDKALQRFQQSQPDCLVTSLAAALTYVAARHAHEPVLATQCPLA
jgi:methanogenic corrinoid protein MtbC1